MRLVLVFLLAGFKLSAQNSLPPVGMWREHLPYQVVIDITQSDNKVYAATPFSIFSVDKSSNEVERFSKISGLSETGVAAIVYDQQLQQLVVAYQNSNIDIIGKKGIINIPDLKRSNVSGNKNVYHIHPSGNLVFLSTGLGVVVIDAKKNEIKDSWFIGRNGGYVKTNGFAKSTTHFYAATDEGLKKTSVNTPNPADFQSWQLLSGSNGLAPAKAMAVVTLSDKVYTVQNDSVFVETATGWNLFFANGLAINGIDVSANKLLISQPVSVSQGRVTAINETGVIENQLQPSGRVIQPQQAVADGATTWIADLAEGLVKATASSIENFKPNSPQSIILGEMLVHNGVLWAAAGTVNSNWNYQFNPAGVQRFADGWWTGYNRFRFSNLDSVADIITLAIDPRDGSVWAGSYGGGLIHFKEGSAPQIFKQNSPLAAPPGDPGNFRVSGLAFDEEGNLWISNFGSSRQIHVLKKDRTWKSFSAPFTIFENATAKILIDDAGQKWIQSPLGNGIIVFNEGDVNNPADDRWKFLRSGGSGNLPSNEVFSIAKDKSGFIWVGTSNGVAVYQCAEEIFSNCNAIWPVVKEGNFANYLFSGQEVRAIAVDGADRKWMGTSSGIYLVSADGDKVLANFTETNSSLVSNDVRQLAINGRTGELYVATAKGLVSFRAAATEAKESASEVLVFPNPVPPGFAGTIAIRGLPENSIVKITEANGRLVHQARSLGGQAVWNGKNYKGQTVAPGVYLVIAVDKLNREKQVTKIVMVGR